MLNTSLNQEPFVSGKHLTESIFDKLPQELVDLALSALQTAGIQPIEWRHGLYGRMHVPLVLFKYSYVVEDACLEDACKIFESLGLPLSSSWSSDTIGDMLSKGRAFRVTRFTLPGYVMHLVLYPASFVDFIPSELAEAPPSHMSHPTCSTVWVPRPSAVYAFLLRAIQRYPRFDHTRGTLCNDLGSLVLYHLLGYTLEDMAEEEDDEEEEQRRTCNAVGVIRRWGAQGEWRAGEEWFEDILVDLATGHARAECLPTPEEPSPA